MAELPGEPQELLEMLHLTLAWPLHPLLFAAATCMPSTHRLGISRDRQPPWLPALH